jgi:ammonia channel protein AmtB
MIDSIYYKNNQFKEEEMAVVVMVFYFILFGWFVFETGYLCF